MNEITQRECVGSAWDHLEEKRTWDREGLDFEKFSSLQPDLGTIIVIQYLSLQFPGHLIPHDLQLYVTLLPTTRPHAGLCYHAAEFHIRILVSHDPLSDWFSFLSLMPSLPFYLFFTLKVMLVPWPFTSHFLPVCQLLGGALNYPVTNTSSPCPATLDQSHNPYLLSYPACQHGLVIL